MRPLGSAVILVLGTLLAAGCGGEGSTVAWEVRFSDAALAEQAVRVETSVRRGGCDAPGLVYRAELRSDAPAPRPPELGPGRYGFTAMARDAECRTIARGCTELELPANETVDVVLEPVSEAAGCASAACVDGLCEGEEPPPDGGVVMPADAGWMPEDADVPAEDAGPPGGDGGTVPEDASTIEPDAGDPEPPCEMRGESCYVYRTEALSWGAAESKCISWGGHLVTIDDGEEQNWLIATFGPVLDVWIGLSDRSTEGQFEWVDGSESTYRAWTGTAPDNKGSGEDCAHLDSGTFGWDDRKCQQGRGYICER